MTLPFWFRVCAHEMSGSLYLLVAMFSLDPQLNSRMLEIEWALNLGTSAACSLY